MIVGSDSGFTAGSLSITKAECCLSAVLKALVFDSLFKSFLF
jgi:hypothetical protein